MTNTPPTLTASNSKDSAMHCDTNRLGRTGIEVTRLGFGATAIGGMYTEVSDAQATDAVAAAYER